MQFYRLQPADPAIRIAVDQLRTRGDKRMRVTNAPVEGTVLDRSLDSAWPSPA